MADEVKREAKVLTEKIPEKLISVVEKAMKANNKVRNEFIQLSFQIAGLEKKKAELYSKLDVNSLSITGKLKYAFDKMKLEKKYKDFSWRFDGKENFIGVEVIKEVKK